MSDQENPKDDETPAGETAHDLRLVRRHIGGEEYMCYAILEYDKETGAIVDVEPIPEVFEDCEDAESVARSIMRASRMDVIDLEVLKTTLH